MKENYPTHVQVAIVGGGMVGASLALLFAQQQPTWTIALIDVRPLANEQHTAIVQPSFDARSTAISQGSVEILDALGVWQALLPHATPIQQVHVSDAGHFMGGLIDAKNYAVAALGYVVPNAWLGRVLFQQLFAQQNICIIAPADVQKIIPLQAGATLLYEVAGQQAELLCELAVIADGGDSPLRRSLGIDQTRKDYNQTALIANVAYTEPHGGVAYERFTPQGPLALLPLGGTNSAKESSLVLTLPNEIAADVVAMNDDDFLQHLQTRFGYRLGKFLRVSKRLSYPLQLITANEQVRSHIALVGNAAHYLHPVAGQGFNLSLRDCSCLVDAVLNEKGSNNPIGALHGLQEYASRQQIDQAVTIEFSDKLVRLFSTQSLPLTVLRHLGFMGLDLLPALKKQFVARTMGTATAKYI